MSIHRASSNSWGNEAGARICQIIIEANDGMAQQIMENRKDLLDNLTIEELERKDDLDLNLSYLAIFYDRPDMLEYLHKRGVNLGKPCDPLDYGTPMFYAVSLQRHRCIVMLDILGYSINEPCTKFGELPEVHAARLDDALLHSTIDHIKDKEFRAVTLFLKHYWRRRLRKVYLEKKRSALLLERIARGYIARKKLKKLKAKRDDEQRYAAVTRQTSVKKRGEVNSKKSRK